MKEISAEIVDKFLKKIMKIERSGLSSEIGKMKRRDELTKILNTFVEEEMEDENCEGRS